MRDIQRYPITKYESVDLAEEIMAQQACGDMAPMLPPQAEIVHDHTTLKQTKANLVKFRQASYRREKG